MKPGANFCGTDRDVLSRPATAPPSSSEILDWEALQNRCMGNLELVERVLDKFQQRLPEELRELESALERGDTERIAGVAHRIKGTSASISATALQHAAAELEELSRADRRQELPARFGLLQSEWARIAQFLEARP
jgi:HPt (histidine-containing phosphotransfer) domain-containing protein